MIPALNTVYNSDCMEIMASLPDYYFDIGLVDPPYFDGPQKKGYNGKGYSSLNIKRSGFLPIDDTWYIPDELYFKELKRVTKNQIIWGANHFAGMFNSSSSCWIVWDKVNGNSSFSDVELAYTSFPGGARMLRYMWNGMNQGKSIKEGHIQQGDKKLNEKRIHPTQKPVMLYKWILDKFAKPGDKILDTHAGSCSSVVACIDMGFDYLACELNKEYYEAAMNRINNFNKQLNIFR